MTHIDNNLILAAVFDLPLNAEIRLFRYIENNF